MKKSEDILDKQMGSFRMPPSNIPEHPARFISTKISPTKGHELQLQTRGNLKMAEAVLFGVVYTEHFKSDFVGGLIDTMMRMGVSMAGEGRKEQIETLRASGSTPDAYYNQMNEQKKRSFLGIRTDDDDGE